MWLPFTERIARSFFVALGVPVHPHPNEDQNPLCVVPRALQGTPSYVTASGKSVPTSLGQGKLCYGLCCVPGAGLGTAMWVDAEPGPKRRGGAGYICNRHLTLKIPKKEVSSSICQTCTGFSQAPPVTENGTTVPPCSRLALTVI